MESSETAGERPLTNLETQLGLIEAAFGEESFGKKLFDDGTLDYLYVRGVILVRDAYVAGVTRLLEEDDEEEDRGQEFVRPRGLLSGVSLFSVGKRDVPRLLDKIGATLGEGVATPDHILSIGSVFSRPDAEPEEVPAGALPDPGVRGSGGAGAFIWVADTGLLDGAAAEHSWLAGVTGTGDPLDVRGGVATIPGYAGHGTFAAGVIRCLAPQARVYISRVFNRAGAVAEHRLIDELVMQRAAQVLLKVVPAPAHASGPSASRAAAMAQAVWLVTAPGLIPIAAGSAAPRWPRSQAHHPGPVPPPRRQQRSPPPRAARHRPAAPAHPTHRDHRRRVPAEMPRLPYPCPETSPPARRQATTHPLQPPACPGQGRLNQGKSPRHRELPDCQGIQTGHARPPGCGAAGPGRPPEGGSAARPAPRAHSRLASRRAPRTVISRPAACSSLKSAAR